MTLVEIQDKRNTLTRELESMDVYDSRKFATKKERDELSSQIALMKTHTIFSQEKVVVNV